ncbi:hypothetical protein V6N13_120351 [Hibiscus sabdariffa]
MLVPIYLLIFVTAERAATLPRLLKYHCQAIKPVGALPELTLLLLMISTSWYPYLHYILDEYWSNIRDGATLYIRGALAPPSQGVF